MWQKSCFTHVRWKLTCNSPQYTHCQCGGTNIFFLQNSMLLEHKISQHFLNRKYLHNMLFCRLGEKICFFLAHMPISISLHISGTHMAGNTGWEKCVSWWEDPVNGCSQKVCIFLFFLKHHIGTCLSVQWNDSQKFSAYLQWYSVRYFSHQDRDTVQL